MRDEDIPNYEWVQRRDVTEHLNLRRPGWANEELQHAPAQTNGEALHEEDMALEMGFSSVAPVFANIYQEVAATEQYRMALQLVIRQARGAWSFASLHQAIDQIDTLETGSTLGSRGHGSPWVTDNKAWIGAAGELYVSCAACRYAKTSFLRSVHADMR